MGVKRRCGVATTRHLRVPLALDSLVPPALISLVPLLPDSLVPLLTVDEFTPARRLQTLTWTLPRQLPHLFFDSVIGHAIGSLPFSTWSSLQFTCAVCVEMGFECRLDHLLFISLSTSAMLESTLDVASNVLHTLRVLG